MPRVTPSFAKNMIRRALREIVDPPPSKGDVDAIWAFFESRCAYCGSDLDRAKKGGHIDHLVPASQSAANHVSNRVLSCPDCNEKEKLDRPWEDFLRQKASDPQAYQERRDRILRWQQEHPIPPYLKDTSVSEEVARLADEAVSVFDAKVEQARSLRRF